MPKTTEKYALLSVWDKSGIVDLAKEVVKLGFQIYILRRNRQKS